MGGSLHMAVVELPVRGRRQQVGHGHGQAGGYGEQELLQVGCGHGLSAVTRF